MMNKFDSETMSQRHFVSAIYLHQDKPRIHLVHQLWYRYQQDMWNISCVHRWLSFQRGSPCIPVDLDKADTVPLGTEHRSLLQVFGLTVPGRQLRHSCVDSSGFCPSRHILTGKSPSSCTPSGLVMILNSTGKNVSVESRQSSDKALTATAASIPNSQLKGVGRVWRKNPSSNGVSYIDEGNTGQCANSKNSGTQWIWNCL